MIYKLTWKRKMKFNCSTSFILLLSATLFNFHSAHAQKDSLHPVQLEAIDLHWVLPGGETPFAGTTVNRPEITGSLGNGSINNLMENIPSMTTSSDAGLGIGNTYMRIRGIDHTRINVTINNIELNDAESQGTWFVNLPNFGFYTQSLSLQRGVGTSTNGAAAFGASMNFSTLENDSPKPFVEVNSAAGSYNTFRNSVTVGTGLIKKRFSATASYSNLQSDGYIERASANLNSIFFTADYRLLNFKKEKDYGTLKFNLLYGKEKTGLSWDGVPSYMLEENRRYNPCGEYTDDEGNTHYYNNETDNYQQTHYQLFYHYKKDQHKSKNTHHYNLNVGIHLTRGIGYYEQYKDNKRYSDYGLSPILNEEGKELKKDLVTRKFLDNYFYGFVFDFSDALQKTEVSEDKESAKRTPWLTWSVGGAVNHYDGKHYGDIIWMQNANNVPPGYQWYYNTGNKIQANLYGKIEYRPTWRILIYGDIQNRYINYRIKGGDDNLLDITGYYQWAFLLAPKTGIHLFLDKEKHHVLYFSFAMSHREPTRSDIVDAPTSKKPYSETLYDFELGYGLQIKKFAFNANLYHMYYQDQLVLTGEINDVGDAIMTNVDKSFRTGLELVASYRPARFFKWKINATFSLNKILDYTHYVDNWDNGEQIVTKLGTTDISFSPNIIAGNEFIFTPIRHFDISLLTKFVSRQFLDNTGDKNQSIKAYSFTNLQLSYKINTSVIPEIGFFFQINNIFNAKYASNGWLYRYYEGGEAYYSDGYYPQATINFMGGIALKF